MSRYNRQPMQKAFVTGANGFIGAALTHRLLRDGIAVRALCRAARNGLTLAEAGAEIVEGDIQDAALMLRHAEGCDVVFHVAAVGKGSFAHQQAVNVEGSHHVAEAAYKAGAQRLVHVSSIAVYGYDLNGPIDESHPHHPPRDDYYMRTKSLGEQAVWQYVGEVGLPTVSVRPAFVYGPRSVFWSRTLCDLCRRYPVPLFAGGRGSAHPIYIDDVVDLLVTVATHPAAPGNAFHAAPDPAISWRDFLGHYAQIAGNPRTINIPLPPKLILKPICKLLSLLARLSGSPYDVYGAVQHLTRPVLYRMDKTKQLLGWQPRIPLEEGMALTTPWLKSLDT